MKKLYSLEVISNFSTYCKANSKYCIFNDENLSNQLKNLSFLAINEINFEGGKLYNFTNINININRNLTMRSLNLANNTAISHSIIIFNNFTMFINSENIIFKMIDIIFDGSHTYKYYNCIICIILKHSLEINLNGIVIKNIKTNNIYNDLTGREKNKYFILLINENDNNSFLLTFKNWLIINNLFENFMILGCKEFKDFKIRKKINLKSKINYNYFKEIRFEFVKFIDNTIDNENSYIIYLKLEHLYLIFNYFIIKNLFIFNLRGIIYIGCNKLMLSSIFFFYMRFEGIITNHKIKEINIISINTIFLLEKISFFKCKFSNFQIKNGVIINIKIQKNSKLDKLSHIIINHVYLHQIILINSNILNLIVEKITILNVLFQKIQKISIFLQKPLMKFTVIYFTLSRIVFYFNNFDEKPIFLLIENNNSPSNKLYIYNKNIIFMHNELNSNFLNIYSSIKNVNYFVLNLIIFKNLMNYNEQDSGFIKIIAPIITLQILNSIFCEINNKIISSLYLISLNSIISISNTKFINNTQLKNNQMTSDIQIFSKIKSTINILNCTFWGHKKIDNFKQQSTLFCTSCNINIITTSFNYIKSSLNSNFNIIDGKMLIFKCSFFFYPMLFFHRNEFFTIFNSFVSIIQSIFTVDLDFEKYFFKNEQNILFFSKLSNINFSFCKFNNYLPKAPIFVIFDSKNSKIPCLFQNIYFHFNFINPLVKNILSDHFLNICIGFSHFNLLFANVIFEKISTHLSQPPDYQSQIYRAILMDFIGDYAFNIGFSSSYFLIADLSEIKIKGLKFSGGFSVASSTAYVGESKFEISNSLILNSLSGQKSSFYFRNCEFLSISNNIFVDNIGITHSLCNIKGMMDRDVNYYMNNNIFVSNLRIKFYSLFISTKWLDYIVPFLWFQTEKNIDLVPVKIDEDLSKLYYYVSSNSLFFGSSTNISFINNIFIFNTPFAGNSRLITLDEVNIINITNNLFKTTTNSTIYKSLNPSEMGWIEFERQFNLTLSSLIMINNPRYYVSFTKCRFYNLYFYKADGTIIHAESFAYNSKLIIKDCIFFNDSLLYGGKGGAVFIRLIDTFIISSIFNNCLSKEYGGAIACVYSSLTIYNSTFINCYSTNGGALFWSVIEPNIDFLSVFKDNIAFYGNNIATDTFKYKAVCISNYSFDYTEKDFSIFDDNAVKSFMLPILPTKFANSIGNYFFGNIFIRSDWEDVNPTEVLSKDNKCNLLEKRSRNLLKIFEKFKKNICIPDNFFDETDFEYQINDSFTGIIIYAAFDFYDQYVDMRLFNKNLELSIISSNDETAQLNAINFYFEKDYRLFIVNFFKFDFFSSLKNKSINLLIQTNFEIPTLIIEGAISLKYLSLLKECESTVSLIEEISVMPPFCPIGYAYQDYRCVLCSNNLYSRTQGSIKCSEIPSHSKYGCGPHIIPQDGYWIEENSLEIYECPFPEVCYNIQSDFGSKLSICESEILENSNKLYSTECENPETPGYFGPMCTSCSFGYTRIQQQYRCGKCENKTLVLTFLMLVLMFFFYFYLILTSRDFKNKIPFTEIFKIISNYSIFNYVALRRFIITDNLWIAQQIKSVLNIHEGLSTPISYFSYKCVIEYMFISDSDVPKNKIELNQYMQKIFYQEKIIILLMPLIYSFCLIIFEYLYTNCGFFSKKKRNPSITIWGLFKQSVFVIHFVFFNDVIRTAMIFFDLRIINNRTKLESEMTITFEYNYSNIFFFLFIIYIFFYAILIPGWGFLNLVRHKKELVHPQFKEKYGFLYVGYHYKVFYWEMIINLFKFLILLGDTNSPQKLLTYIFQLKIIDVKSMTILYLFTIRFIYFLMILKYYPYKSKYLNDLEKKACFFSLFLILLIIVPVYFFEKQGLLSYYLDKYLYLYLLNDFNQEKEIEKINLIKNIVLSLNFLLVCIFMLYLLFLVVYKLTLDIFKELKIVLLRNKKKIPNFIKKSRCFKDIFIEKRSKRISTLKEYDNEKGSFQKILRFNNYIRYLYVVNKKYYVKKMFKNVKKKRIGKYSHKYFTRAMVVIKNFLLETQYIIPKLKLESIIGQEALMKKVKIDRENALIKQMANLYNIDSQLEKENYLDIHRKREEIKILGPRAFTQKINTPQEDLVKTLEIFSRIKQGIHSKEASIFLHEEISQYRKGLYKLIRVFQRNMNKISKISTNNGKNIVLQAIFSLKIMVENVEKILKYSSKDEKL